MTVIKIHLSDFKTEDQLRNFLFELSDLVASDNFGRINWNLRMDKIKEFANKFPYMDIITTAIGFAK